MKIAILTSLNQWFISYAKSLEEKIDNSKLFFNHKEIDKSYEIVFILSYHQIIEEKYLKRHKHNIIVHESALPNGKGWAPMFWQVLEGKNEITFTMFEASVGVDSGDIYFQRNLILTGYELNHQLREKQANMIMTMCIDFIDSYDIFKTSKKQIGIESFYRKRVPKDSELDINKTIKEQFNLLRIVDNVEYPAFFYIDGHKYLLKIEKDENENR